MSRWWTGKLGLFVVCLGALSCGPNFTSSGSFGQTSDGNSTGDSNTSTGTTGAGGNVTASPTPSPSASPTPTPTPTPTCPTPANANDYYGLPRCCHTHAKLCEDFESGTVGASPNSTLWTVTKATADTMQISSTQAARGNQSLHIRAANAGSQHAMISNTSAFPFANNMFWGRAFVYFNSAYPSNHTTYMAAGPSPNPNYQWLRYSSFGSGHLGGNDSDPDNSAASNQSLPQAAWACLEWQYDVPNLKAYYYFNGQLIATLAIDSKHVGTTDLDFKQVEIGWELYSQDGAGGAAWDMYFDEIALNDTRIGCSN